MISKSGLPVALFILPICAVLAIFIGYLLATPTDFGSYSFLSLILGVLVIPLMLKWHHAFLICCWNAMIIVFFLPGQPRLGIVASFASLFIALVSRTMSKESKFIRVPSLSLSLIVLTIIVVVTAQFTGGMGTRALGSEIWGGKRYFELIGAIVGFFALTSDKLDRKWLVPATSLFFLGDAAAVVSDLAYAAGPAFYFLFAFFPADVASQQASTDTTILRLTGPSWAAIAGFNFLLMRYGIQGLADLTRPWRSAAFLACLSVSLFGGYRSTVIVLFLTFCTQFYFEGLLRSKFLPIALLVLSVIGTGIVAFSERLPLSMQRSLSFLPLELSPVARHDAAGTLDWRLQMWKTLMPDIPKYFFLGKGFSFSGTDYRLTGEAIKRGLYNAYEDTLVSGNYHNGILTIIIPFGIWGFMAFVWFCWLALKAIHRNYLYGEASLKTINTFIMASFTARLAFYFVLYGQFDLDLPFFTGLTGLSITLNGGIKGPGTEVVEEKPYVSYFRQPEPAPIVPQVHL